MFYGNSGNSKILIGRVMTMSVGELTNVFYIMFQAGGRLCEVAQYDENSG